MTTQASAKALEALKRIKLKLERAGAKIPCENEGTIESAMRNGLSIALLLVTDEINALSSPSSTVMDEKGEREAFEAWINQRDGCTALTWDAAMKIHGEAVPEGMVGRYITQREQTAWEAWQARANHQADEIDLDRVLSLADVHAEESNEDGTRLLDRGGLFQFAKDVLRIFGEKQ